MVFRNGKKLFCYLLFQMEMLFWNRKKNFSDLLFRRGSCHHLSDVNQNCSNSLNCKKKKQLHLWWFGDGDVSGKVGWFNNSGNNLTVIMNLRACHLRKKQPHNISEMSFPVKWRLILNYPRHCIVIGVIYFGHCQSMLKQDVFYCFLMKYLGWDSKILLFWEK